MQYFFKDFEDVVHQGKRAAGCTLLAVEHVYQRSHYHVQVVKALHKAFLGLLTFQNVLIGVKLPQECKKCLDVIRAPVLILVPVEEVDSRISECVVVAKLPYFGNECVVGL